MTEEEHRPDEWVLIINGDVIPEVQRCSGHLSVVPCADDDDGDAPEPERLVRAKFYLIHLLPLAVTAVREWRLWNQRTG